MCTSSSVASLAGPSCGMTWMTPTVLASLVSTGTAATTPGTCAQAVGQVQVGGLGAVGVQPRGQVGDDHDGAVVAAAEAVADQLVGL